MKADLVIKNGYVCTETEMIFGGIAIKDGIIVMIGPDAILPEAEEVYDAKENYIFPGVVEPHCHLGSDNPEFEDGKWARDIYSESRTAAQGGITTIHSTVKNYTLPMDERMDIAAEALEGGRAYADFKFYVQPFSEQNLNEIDACVEKHGTGCYKFLLGYRGKAAERMGMPASGCDTGMMYKGFSKVASVGGVAMVHCEDPAVSEVTAAKVKQEVPDGNYNYLEAFNRSQPSICESIDLAKSAYVANEVGCPLYVVHISAEETVDDLEYFKKQKAFDITGETCLHYLIFNCDEKRAYTDWKWVRNAKVNPPIREKSDQDRLWRGINDGIITQLGTDHVNYNEQTKFGGDFWSTGVGTGDGMSSSLTMMLSEGVNKNKCSLETVRKIMCENNAKALGLYPKKGHLAVGADADVVIIDLQKKWTLKADEMESTHCGSLYDGREVTGGPVATFLRGKLVAENYKIVAEEGTGEEIKFYQKRRLTRDYR